MTRPVRVRIARRPGCDDLPLPSAATPGSAGFDLPAAVVTPKVIAPGDRALIPTGFSIAVPPGYEARFPSASTSSISRLAIPSTSLPLAS